ncbi:MAG: class I adenylate-forming enzyme family protein [Gammaproteobacteria bacterium]
MSELSQEYDALIAELTSPGAHFELVSDTQPYYKNAPANLAEAIAVGRSHGNAEFLVYEGERFSFNDVMNAADELSTALQAHGIRPGDRVACAMRNYPEWMVIFIAVVNIGAVIVPVNSWGQPADIAYTVVDSGAKLVFCDQQRYDGCAGIFQEKGIEPVIARPVDDAHPQSLSTFVADFCGQHPQPVDIAPDDLAMIMYTSGTSGKPKGAVSTHRAISQALFNMECAGTVGAMGNQQILATQMEKGYRPTHLLAVPLFHVSGCYAQFLASLRRGGRIVIMYKWDVDKALEYIEQERITQFNAAPSMYLDLLSSPNFDDTDIDSLYALGIGGAATPPKLAKLMQKKVQQNFAGAGYGLTESNAQGASLTAGAFASRPGSSGFPHPIIKLKILAEDGNELPAGESGEIWINSVSNIREYWNRPEANAVSFRDGWLNTGDIGYLNEEGLLYLSDRAKDMIIRGGENIYPAEIENELIEHPAVKEVAAIGVPDDRLGEQVAVVVHLQAHLTEEGLIAFAKSRLAPYKVPTQVIFSDTPLPRNPSKKLMKPVIKESVYAQLGIGS